MREGGEILILRKVQKKKKCVKGWTDAKDDKQQSRRDKQPIAHHICPLYLPIIAAHYICPLYLPTISSLHLSHTSFPTSLQYTTTLHSYSPPLSPSSPPSNNTRKQNSIEEVKDQGNNNNLLLAWRSIQVCVGEKKLKWRWITLTGGNLVEFSGAVITGAGGQARGKNVPSELLKANARRGKRYESVIENKEKKGNQSI